MKKILALFLALVAIPHMAYAQSAAAYELFMGKVTSWSTTTVAFASNGVPLVSTAAPVFTASTFAGGGTAISTAAEVAVGTGKAAVTVKALVTGAEIMAGVKLLVMGGGGLVGIGLTALTLYPLVRDYFANDRVKLGPDSGLSGSTPFQVGRDEMDTSCQATFASILTAHPTYRVRVDTSGYCFVESPNSYPVGTWSGVTDGWPTPTMAKKWYPASMDDIAPYMDKPVDPAVFKALLDAGLKLQVVPRSATGPAEVVHPSTKATTETAEKLTTTTTTPKTKLEYTTKVDPVTGQTVPVVKATPVTEVTVVEKDKATGVERVVSTTATETPKPAAPTDFETCGLPGKPKCLIDETGTPEPKDLEEQKKVDDIYKPLKDIAEDPKTNLPQLPALNWSFALPSGCMAIALPAFAPFLQDIDICQFTPMFHDIMSIVWVIGGLFGAIGTFWRNVFSQA